MPKQTKHKYRKKLEKVFDCVCVENGFGVFALEGCNL